jgi:hypothetical protein
MAAPMLNRIGCFSPVIVEPKWDWSTHRSIRDCVPLHEVVEEPIFSGEIEPMIPRTMSPKTEEDQSRSVRRKMEKKWACSLSAPDDTSKQRLVSTGKVLTHSHYTQKDQTSTITGKRRNLVRQLRYEMRDRRRAVAAAWDHLYKTEF